MREWREKEGKEGNVHNPVGEGPLANEKLRGHNY